MSSLDDSSQAESSLIEENSQTNLLEVSPPVDESLRQQDHFYEDLLNFQKYMHGELSGLWTAPDQKSGG